MSSLAGRLAGRCDVIVPPLTYTHATREADVIAELLPVRLPRRLKAAKGQGVEIGAVPRPGQTLRLPSDGVMMSTNGAYAVCELSIERAMRPHTAGPGVFQVEK
jgi:hypothetical protein